MQRIIFASALLIFLNACVTLPPQVDFSTRAEGGNIGIINFLPHDLIHNHYGILPGLSQRHAYHQAPFDVGGEFAEALSLKINEHTGFKAKVIAAPPVLEKIRFDTARIASSNYRSNHPWWNDRNWVVDPQFVEVFRDLAAQQSVDSFIIVSPYWQYPSLHDGLPPSFSYAVQTKKHSPWYFSHSMLSVVCLAFDMEHLRARDLCEESPNSIALENYIAPEDPAAPLPRIEEIGNNLLTLLRGKVIEVIETLNGFEPGSLKDMTFTSRPTITIQASTRVDDEISPLDYYGQAEAEMGTETYDKNLWAKALVEAEGDETKRKAKFIELRANQLYIENGGSISKSNLSEQTVTHSNSGGVSGIYRSEITSNRRYMFQQNKHRELTITLKQEGNSIVGVDYSTDSEMTGTREGDTIKFKFWSRQIYVGGETSGEWKVIDDGNRLEGFWGSTLPGSSGGKWNLTRME